MPRFYVDLSQSTDCTIDVISAYERTTVPSFIYAHKDVSWMHTSTLWLPLRAFFLHALATCNATQRLLDFAQSGILVQFTPLLVALSLCSPHLVNCRLLVGRSSILHVSGGERSDGFLRHEDQSVEVAQQAKHLVLEDVSTGRKWLVLK